MDPPNPIRSFINLYPRDYGQQVTENTPIVVYERINPTTKCNSTVDVFALIAIISAMIFGFVCAFCLAYLYMGPSVAMSTAMGLLGSALAFVVMVCLSNCIIAATIRNNTEAEQEEDYDKIIAYEKHDSMDIDESTPKRNQDEISELEFW